MKKRMLFHKKYCLIPLLILQGFIAVWVFFHFYTYHAEFSYGAGDMMVEKAMQSAAAGHRVDKTYQGTDRAVITPKMSLDNGIYRVVIRYDSDNPYYDFYDDNHIYSLAMDVEDQARYSVDSDQNELPGYENTISYTFYVHEHSTDVSIHNVLVDGVSDYLDVNGVQVTYLNQKTAVYYFLRVIFWILVLDLFILFVFLRREATGRWLRERGTVLSVMAGILFLSEIPMMLDFIFSSHDLYFHSYRIQQLAQGMEYGMFPVKIQPGWMNGYGYATGVFYGDLLLYIPAFLNIAGFPLHFCYKFYVLMINCLTIAVSYFAFRKIGGSRKTGLFGCTVYSLSIYRFCDLYSRAAAGEYTAMAFLPLVMLGFWMIYDRPDNSGLAVPGGTQDLENRNGWLFLMAGMTGIIESHILTAEMVCIFSVLFILLMGKRTFCADVMKQLVRAVLSTFLINLFFIIPFVDYFLHHRLLNDGTFDAEERVTEYLATIFSTFYGTTGMSPENKYIGAMPLSLGFAGGVILVIAFCMVFRRQYDKANRAVSVMLFLTAISIWLCTNLFPYRFVAQHLKPLYTVLVQLQFPWRFLTVATILISMIAVVSVTFALKHYDGRAVWMAAALICVFVGYQALDYSGIYLNENRYDQGNRETMVCISDSFREAGKQYVLYGTDVEKMTDNSLSVSDKTGMTAVLDSRKGIQLDSSVTNPSSDTGYVDYPLQNYRGYHAVDSAGSELRISNGDNNRVRVSIPAGYSGTVRVYFQEPWYWRAAELLSLAYLLCLLVRSRRHFCKNALARKNRVV
jgi:hypothetical protein